MKDVEQRSLPPGSTSQETLNVQTQIDALKRDVEELKRQMAALKKP